MVNILYFYIVIKNYKKRQNINLINLNIMNTIKQNPGQSIFVAVLTLVVIAVTVNELFNVIKF